MKSPGELITSSTTVGQFLGPVGSFAGTSEGSNRKACSLRH